MPSKRISIAWEKGPAEGHIEVEHGAVVAGEATNGGEFSAGRFTSPTPGLFRLTLAIDAASVGPGAYATRVSVCAGPRSFTFWLRDVCRAYPILIPTYGVAVTEAEDGRGYDEIRGEIGGRGLLSNLQRIEGEPEESYDEAAAHTRRQRCPTWLGVGRDIRIFEVGPRTPERVYDNIQPRLHGDPVTLEGAGDRPGYYDFLLGRGWGCAEQNTRWLDGGVLPILRQQLVDDDILYDSTTFVTLERSGLPAAGVRGTHFLVAEAHGLGHMLTPEQQRAVDALEPGETAQPEETLLCCRVEAINTARVPRYAFLRNAAPKTVGQWQRPPYRFEEESGLAVYPSGKVFCVSRLNGRPLPQEEVAVLLPPGEKAVFELLLPHQPIPRERAEALGQVDITRRLEECRAFWSTKLQAAAHVELPEQRIDEMVRAGLLHLDLIAYGREPDGPLAATVGVYSHIGSESAPVIQLNDSMGRHDVARRMLAGFLEMQHDDGFIQTFGGYMLETGCVLWSLGEHYRYTRDEAWVREVAPRALRACDYLLRWRERNRRDELRGRGYGLLEGKAADPEEQERVFMLNGYAYVGLSRAAEMLAGSYPEQSARLRAEAEGLRADIRTALAEALAAGPVVPLGDGTWCPSAAGCTGYPGPLSLHAEGGTCVSHGTVATRDALLGPLYLVLQEVLDPDEEATRQLLYANAELYTMRNTGLSQPYYYPHPWAHLRRGEVKPFLKAYYNGIAGLADRETYTFWEHYWQASPHKVHEEAWFLMQTRWMLYLEEGETLRLLPGIPRAWLEDGKRIVLDRAASYFGPLSLCVTSDLRHGQIQADVRCTARPPRRLVIRLPHPQGRRAVAAEGGRYDLAAEAVIVEGTAGEAHVRLSF